MPKQIGLIKLKGVMDDIVFSKSQDGYIAQKKALFNPSKFKNDPNYEQTRLNAMEFGIGGNAGRTLREAFTSEVFKASDNRMVSRLTQLMITALRADTESDFGYRQVQNGDLSLLDKFDFNGKVPFSATVKLQPEVAVNRATGQVSITIPPHIPTERVAAPARGVSHYRLFAATAALDFASGASAIGRVATANLAYDNTERQQLDLVLTLPAASDLPIVVILGVEFMKVVNGKMYPNTKKENALQIIAIDQAA